MTYLQLFILVCCTSLTCFSAPVWADWASDWEGAAHSQVRVDHSHGGRTKVIWNYNGSQQHKYASISARVTGDGPTASPEGGIVLRLRALQVLPGSSGRGNNPVELVLEDEAGRVAFVPLLIDLPERQWVRFTIPFSSPYWRGREIDPATLRRISFRLPTRRLDPADQSWTFEIADLQPVSEATRITVENEMFTAQLKPGDSYRVATGRGIGVHYVDDLVKVYPKTILTDSIRLAAELDGARGETVSFQLYLALDEATPTAQAVALEVADLTTGHSQIPSSQVDIYREAYVDYRHESPYAQYIPEVLYPADATMTLDTDMPNILWFDLAIPKDAAAGTYRGVITFHINDHEGDQRIDVPVQLRVWDVIIPRDLPVGVIAKIRPTGFKGLYDADFEDVVDGYYQVLADHKINGLTSQLEDSPLPPSGDNSIPDFDAYLAQVKDLATAYGFTHWRIPNLFISERSLERVEGAEDRWTGGTWRGLRVFNNEGQLTQQFSTAYQSYIDAFVQAAEQAGIKDYFQIRIVDEIAASQEPNYYQLYRLAAAVSSGIPNSITGLFDEMMQQRMTDVIQYWTCHILFLPELDQVAAFQDNGHAVGLYYNYSNLIYLPDNSWMRSIGWCFARYELKGNYYFWAITNWSKGDVRFDDTRVANPVHEAAFYDANFMYPNREGGEIEGVSLRLKAFRNGMQEHQIFYQVDQLIDQRLEEGTLNGQEAVELRSTLDDARGRLMTNKWHHLHDASVLREVRRNVLQMGETLNTGGY